MNFALAQKNLFVAIRHGLLRIVEMILDFSPADLMFEEIVRHYRSEEHASFFLGVSSNWRFSQRATPYQWARIFGRLEVVQLFEERMGKRQKTDFQRFRSQERSFDLAAWADQNSVTSLHDAVWCG